MKWLKWLALAAFILCLIISKVEEHGFCIKEMTFLQDIYTEQEIIDQAIAYKIQHIPSAIGWRGKGEGKDIKIIPYRTVEEFKEKNPNCCTLTRKLPENDPHNEYGFVRIEYLRYYENNARSPEKYTSYIPYNSCGEITLKR